MVKIYKKSVVYISLFTLILTTSVVQAFLDVSDDAFYYNALNWAVSEEIIDNREYFRPADPVNRAEMAKMVVQSLQMPLDASQGPSFLDVHQLSWYYDFVETGKANKLFDGYSNANGFATGFFGPTDFVTRSAVAKVLTKAYGLESAACSTKFRDVDYSSWYAPYIDSMCVAKIIKGDRFRMARPGDNINRAEFITMLHRAAGAPYVVPPEGFEVAPLPGIAPDIDIEAYGIFEPELNISALNSAGLTIPSDAAGVTFTTLSFTADGADITIDGLTIWRNGLGSHTDFSDVWLSVDGFKRGSNMSFGSDDKATFNLGSNAISIVDGQTIEVEIKASMSGTAGTNTQNRIGLRSVNDVDAGLAKITGSFPIYGGDMEVEKTQIEESSVNFPNFDAQVYNNFARLNAPTGICPDGSCAAHVAQFALTPMFDNIRLKKLSLRNDDNLQNFTGRFGTFFLVHEGRVIDTGSFNGSSSGDGMVVFDGFNHLLTKGTRHKLNVLAEIHDVKRAENSGSFLKLYIENSEAIEMISDTNGFDIPSSNYVTTQAGPTGDYIQTHIIRKSYPIIQYQNQGIQTSITGGVSNREVYRFSISAHPNGDIEWDHLTFYINESAGISSSNYKLYVENSSNALNAGASLSGGKVVIDPLSMQEVPKGQTVNYILKTDIAITNTVQSQNLDIELSAAGDTSLATGTTTSLSFSDFLWSDRSAVGHSPTTSDWTNGFEVDRFNTETIHIGYQG